MLAVLYVAHGSRIPEGVRQADLFLHDCMKNVSSPIQEICYLELVRPTIEQGIRRCAERGATVILVQPLLLLSAGHAKRDIPGEIEKARARYPEIKFVYGRPFGVDPKIVNLLIKRLNEKQSFLPEGSGILLVGRGSSDPDTKRSFTSICRLLNQKGIKHVDVCYMAAASPSFEEGLNLATSRGWKQTFVIPYLLFTGVLMKTMKKRIELKNKNGGSFVLCRPLGYHPDLVQLMVKRIGESLENAVSDYA
ncbi:sirohydrochlorin chelatase [Sporolactobacillus sp. THM7-4]|nr:sirohydrochlorin chelatase [Sporolactobacillus sp. THM7-4]